MAASRTSRALGKNRIKQNPKNVKTEAEDVLARIASHLELQSKLLMLLAVSGDLSKQGREVQISALASAGVQQAEIARFFGISKQAVSQAIKRQSK